jgi:TonB family protein
LLALSDELLSAGERALATGRLDEATLAADTVALVRAKDSRVRALRLQVGDARLAQVLSGLPAGLPADLPPFTATGGATPSGDASAVRTAAATLPPPAPLAGETALRKIVDAMPVYPEAAKKANVEGWVELVYTVDAQGRTGNVRVLSGEPAGTFDAAAIDAVRRWRYEPLSAPQQANVRLWFSIER